MILGPAWKPFVGNVPEVKKLSIALGGQHLAFEKMSKDHNTFILGVKLGPEKFIVVSSYRLVKEILTKEEYEGRPNSFFIRLRSFGTRKGIFKSNNIAIILTARYTNNFIYNYFIFSH